MNQGDHGKEVPTPLFLKNTVAVYTVLAIIKRIKSTMGLEAMLEYIEHYQKTIERHNPEFGDAVKSALALTNVEKIYREMTKDEI